MPIRVATVRAGDVPASQTNFPFFIDPARVGVSPLTLAEINSSRWYTDTDLVTQMAREIVSVSEAHGKYASFTSTSKVAIDYDGIRADLAVGDTFGRNNVWSDYRAVWHGNDDTTSTFTDSTGGGWTATKGGANQPNQVTGKLDKAQDFTSSNYFATASSSTSLNMTSNCTVSCWIKPNAFMAASGVIYHKSRETKYYREGIWLDISPAASTNRVQFSIGLNGGYPSSGLGATAITNGTWNLLHGTYTPSTEIRAYLNGVSDAVSTSSIPASTANNSESAQFGRYNFGGSFSRYLNASVDELRLRPSTLSANWITTEYNNQNDEATFWGTWTTFGGGGGFTPTPLMHMRLMAGGMV